MLHRLGAKNAVSPLRYRLRAELPFVYAAEQSRPKLLFDTTVYIDKLQQKFPTKIDDWVRKCEQWHSPITEAELAYACGRLDPRHAQTTHVIEKIRGAIEKRSVSRILEVDREIWQEAAVLCGILARLQQHEKSETSRLLNDALIFFTAQKHECTVLTRNVRDFDLMLQIVPSGRVLFYQRF